MLLPSELARLKFELGFNLLDVGAEPYVSVTRYFEQVFLPNLNAGALTTSATVVSAASSPTPVALTLTSATGFNLLDRVIVDVDDAQEEATIQLVSGAAITVRLAKAHGAAGAYPVSVEGGASMIRWYLARLRTIAIRIDQFGPMAGIKKADEVEFFGGGSGMNAEQSGFRTLADMQRYFRSELCKLVFGVGDIQSFGGGGSRIGIY